MIRHNAKIALRVLNKNRLYSAINVIGLSIAFGVALLIFLFVQDEFTFDNWHDNADRIVRIDRVGYNPDGTIDNKSPWMPFPLAEALVRDHPLVESVVRMRRAEVVLRANESSSKQTVLFADSTLLSMFTYPALRGDSRTALADPLSIVLTRSAAIRHFGSIDVIGETVGIRFEDEFDSAIVTAVLDDLPSNTNIPFEYLLPFDRMAMEYNWVIASMDKWRNWSFNVFALLRADAELSVAQQTLSSLWQRYYPDQKAEMIAAGTWTGAGDPVGFEFIPLKSLHLDTSATGTLVATSDPVYSYVLLAIGLLIVALASINFVILTIGRGATRATEIGVRKALGAKRSQLIRQFSSESILLSLVSFFVGIGGAALVLPTFNTLAAKNLVVASSGTIPVLVVLLLTAIGTGVMAGWYPSVVISRHDPTDTLRGRFRLGSSNTLTRSLLVAQFSTSIILVSGALVMNQQLKSIQESDLGYDPANIVVVDANRTDARLLSQHLDRTIGTRADVSGIGTVSNVMNSGSQFQDWRVGDAERRAYIYHFNAEALRLLDIELAAGRMLDERLASDLTDAVLVNEAFAEQLGLTAEAAVGERVTGYGQAPVIAGVVRNLNFQSLRVAVEPMILSIDPSAYMASALIKSDRNSLRDVLTALETAWESFAPDVPLTYTFLDDQIALSYANDRRWSQIVGYSAGLAVLIACMGLFGLASLTMVRRTKEIGVRKILGASVANILLLVVRDFVRLIAIASVVAIPIAYTGLNKWLEGFAYHITLSMGSFAIAGLSVLAIALGTVSWISIRTALGNPVNSLRYE